MREPIPLLEGHREGGGGGGGGKGEEGEVGVEGGGRKEEGGKGRQEGGGRKGRGGREGEGRERGGGRSETLRSKRYTNESVISLFSSLQFQECCISNTEVFMQVMGGGDDIITELKQHL